MAFIVNVRTAQNPIALAAGIVASASLQVTDLWPNISQRNQIYDPRGLGPFYCNQAANNAVPVAGGVTTAAVEGLTAYLIANLVDVAAGNFNITTVVAGTVANDGALQSIFDDVYVGTGVPDRPGDQAITFGRINANAGAKLVNTVLNIALAGPDGNAAPTNAEHVINILQILAGARFSLPAGTVNNVAALGTFNSQVMNQAQFISPPARIADTDSSLNNSMLNGQLSFLGNDALQLFGAAAAARVVQVYSDTGTLLM